MSNPARIVVSIGAAVVVAAASFGCAGTKSNSTAQATPEPAPYHASQDNTTGQSPPVVVASNTTPSSGYTGTTLADNSRPMGQERAPRADRN
jgi:hypothetical protein